MDKLRLEKLKKLRELGIEPYPYKYKQTHHSLEIKNNFSKLANKKVSVAGRIMSIRGHGKILFCDLRDWQGDIQIVIQYDKIGPGPFELFKLFDVGDIIGVTGTVFKTKRGEISVLAKKIELLSKSLRQIPAHWYGLKDVEIRYRRRYLDLILNPQVRDIFKKRTKIIDSIRTFLNKRGFVEVETPILQPIYGGAAARPFKTFLHDLKMDVYLRISDELYLKRLIVGGFEKVYEFAKDFRNESIDRTHNPEFTQVELYQAYADYYDIMDLFEKMMKFVAKQVLGTTKFEYQGTKIDFAKWERLTIADAIKKHTGVDVLSLSDKELRALIKEFNLELPKNALPGLIINELFEKHVQNKLVKPTILMDHPRETTPLCKFHRQNPLLVERFEPFVGGMELGNAYSELNDPIVQRQLFEEQVRFRELGDEESHPMDEDFLRALEYGMPPTGGLGIGIDRLTMVLTNQPNIREVILFPFMRPEEKHRAMRK